MKKKTKPTHLLGLFLSTSGKIGYTSSGRMVSSKNRMSRYKFIVTSNRLPVTVKKIDGKLEFTNSSGGLATAMSSLDMDPKESLWVGWPGISSDELTKNDKAAITKELRKYNCYPVHLTQAQVQAFYEGYSNDTLWPLFHYFQSYVTYNEAYWSAYENVNQLFLKAITKNSKEDACIWVHDYHLMLLPALLRQKLPNLSVGFFLHIPFPAYEIFRLLPERKQILRGLLGADLIGFHIYDYAVHFLNSCHRMLGFENNHGAIDYKGRTIKIDSFPIGIDYKKFSAALKDPETKREMTALDDHYRGQKIILSVDRLDYSKGIMQRLEAFDLFLQENPVYHKKVALIMVAVPSRTEVTTYKELRDSIEQTVSRINGIYGSVDWTPISYQFKNLPFAQVVALYAKSDVALVTPLRDGMNLVAKEYVAAKKDNNGVLILSEMAGAIDELYEALRINPNNIRSIAVALKTALKMSKEEKSQRLRNMRTRIASYSVQRWGADFIEQLNGTKASQIKGNNKLITVGTSSHIKKDLLRAKKRLVLLDYDGTIRNFVSSPDPRHSKPPLQLRRLLQKIALDPTTKLCIVSGRTKEALDMWFGTLPIALAAEHGAWIKFGDEWSSVQSSYKEQRKGLLALLQQYAERTAGAHVEEKDFGLVWHYRNVPKELAYVRNTSLMRDLGSLLSNSDIGVYNGNSIIEIKPVYVTKAQAAAELLALHPADCIIAAGDDYTDEDMFRGLPEDAHTFKVGPGDTSATYQVADTETMIKLLQYFYE